MGKARVRHRMREIIRTIPIRPMLDRAAERHHVFFIDVKASRGERAIDTLPFVMPRRHAWSMSIKGIVRKTSWACYPGRVAYLSAKNPRGS